jgi:hypothetical protein
VIKNLLRLFIIIVISVPSFVFSASTYYVDSSVGSSGNGTIGSPWKQLSNINWTTVGSASKPCTVLVSGGASGQTYNVSNSGIFIAASGSGIGSEVIFKAATEADWTGHGGVVKVVGAGGGWETFVIDAESYVIIDGFNMDPGNIRIDSEGGNITNITIRNCWIHNWSTQGDHYGIQTAVGGQTQPIHYLTISNNRIGPPNVAADQDPISLDWTSYCTIEKNILEFNPNAGGHADIIHMQGGSDHFIVRYNWFRGGAKNSHIFFDAETDAGTQANQDGDVYANIFENAWDNGTASNPAIVVYHDGPHPNHTLRIYNNVFANMNNVNGGDEQDLSLQIHPNGTASNVFISQNNIYYNSRFEVKTPNVVTNYTMNHNLYYENDGRVAPSCPSNPNNLFSWPTDTCYTSLSSFVSATGKESTVTSMQVEPQLTSLSYGHSLTHDFRPVAGSPVIGTGIDLGSSYNTGLSMETLYSDWPWYDDASLGKGVTLATRTTWDIGPYVYSVGGSSGATLNGVTGVMILR